MTGEVGWARERGATRQFALAAVLAAVAVMVAGGTAGSGGAASAGAGAEGPGPISWVATGDSYSSGEGVAGNQGECARSTKAYGPLAASRLRARGWMVTPEAFTACTGYQIEDLFNSNPRSGGLGPSLWDQAVAQAVPDRVDLVTFSAGGNDLGFEPVIRDCLLLPDSWHDISLGLSGCDVTADELRSRVDAFLAPRPCVGARQRDRAEYLGSQDGFECDLLIAGGGTQDRSDDLRGSLVDLYVYVAEHHLTERGRLVVVGYPAFFAPSDQWPMWGGGRCAGFLADDADMLGEQAGELDRVLATATQRANERLGAERVHYISLYGRYRDGGHELCGPNRYWLNGITLSRDEVSVPEGGRFRLEGSFHPNRWGHADTASALVSLVAQLDWAADSDDDGSGSDGSGSDGSGSDGSGSDGADPPSDGSGSADPRWPVDADNAPAGFYVWMGAASAWPGTGVDGFPEWVQCSQTWCITGTSGGSILLIQIDPSPGEAFAVHATLDPLVEPRVALTEAGLGTADVDALLG